MAIIKRILQRQWNFTDNSFRCPRKRWDTCFTKYLFSCLQLCLSLSFSSMWLYSSQYLLMDIREMLSLGKNRKRYVSFLIEKPLNYIFFHLTKHYTALLSVQFWVQVIWVHMRSLHSRRYSQIRTRELFSFAKLILRTNYPEWK